MEIFTQMQKTNQDTAKGDIVLVHGSWGSSEMWAQYIQRLPQEGWNIYALDLRGHGKSQGEISGATMDDYVADVHQAVSEYEINDPIVIGHSMGGLVVLMYAAKHNPKAVVSIDPSPTKEVQGSQEKNYPDTYSPVDAGMPTDPQEVMKSFPDIPKDMLMKMKDMLGMESGAARSQRKLGISVPKEALSMPTLFVGGELGESVDFGIGIKTAKKLAEYYDKAVIEIAGATHPGTLVGEQAPEAIRKINDWLTKNVTN
jgi:pimeloyl-ACP methyl ester carboxylesterase